MIRHIVSDSFFDADIVQIVVTGGGDKPLQIAVVPRVANVTVDLGTTVNLVGKLATLRRFYEKGLSRIGWDKYSQISLRYDGQVVCR
jgi:cell division protein FtsQ